MRPRGFTDMKTIEDSGQHNEIERSLYRTIFIGEDVAANSELIAALIDSGCSMLSQIETKISLAKFKEYTPDLAIIVKENPCTMFLKSIEEMQNISPCTVVMFTGDDSRETIQLATRSGVHAYLTELPKARRMKVVIDVAVERYKAIRALREELEASKEALSDRKIVERAKGILMQRKSLDEPSAYRAMQKLAMDRNVKLVELAQSMISAAEILE